MIKLLGNAPSQATDAATKAYVDSVSSAPVPQVPTAGFTVAANTQVLFFRDIDMSAANGDLTVNGLLQGVH